MSDPVADALMSQLIEMGFAEAQAAAYSTAYHTLEGALEALLRDEATQGHAPLPVPAGVVGGSSVGVGIGPVDERKETVSEVLGPTEWMPIKCDALASEECDEDDDDDESEKAARDEDASDKVVTIDLVASNDLSAFEVVHASLAAASDKALSEWSAAALHASFAAASSTTARDPECEPERNRAASVTQVDDAALIAAASVTSPTRTLSESTDSSACTTPRTMSETNSVADFESGLCCFCMDATTDTLLLPCRHLSLCSACALDYFSRVRTHNHAVHLLKTAELARGAESLRTGVVLTPIKAVSRVCACPTCATPADSAVRRRTAAATTE